MDSVQKIEDALATLRSHVRSRPGMYLGAVGGLATARLLNGLAVAILLESDQERRPTLAIKIDEGRRSRITFGVEGVLSRHLHASDPLPWVDPRNAIGRETPIAMAAAEEFSMRVIDRHGVGN